MLSITIGNVKFSTRVTGQPPSRGTALLIHGLNTNMAFWHPLLIRALGDARHLLMYDQRGHGYTDLTPTGYTTAQLAEDARGILDAYDVGAADVVAHSFGAGVALQLARLYPNRVRSLVILDGRSHLLQPELRLGQWVLFDRWKSHFAAIGIDIPDSLDLDFTLPLHLHKAGLQLNEIRGRLRADGFFLPSKSRRAAQKYRNLITQTTAPRDFRDPAGMTHQRLARIHQPAHLIYGELSPYLPTRDGLLAHLPNCTLDMLSEAGHNFPFLRPRETTDRILKFWNDQQRLSPCTPTDGGDPAALDPLCEVHD
jgi:pimeloyl-ACP methyl ester carboxylesterase